MLSWSIGGFAELLCVLVDVSATSWRELEDLATRDAATSGEAAPALPKSVSFGTFVSALAAFATLFQLNDRWNRLAVLAFDESSSCVPSGRRSPGRDWASLLSDSIRVCVVVRRTQVFPGRDGFGEEPVDPRLLAETLRRELPRLRRRSEKALHEEEGRLGDDEGSRKEAEAVADAVAEGGSGRRVRARTEASASRSSRSALVRALSQSLCFIHADQRRRGGVSGSTDAGTAGRSGSSSDPAVAAASAVVPGGGSAPGTTARVLVCSGGRDDRTSYVSFMNAVFSAESRGVAIDACDLNRAVESAYLAQAAHLSGASSGEKATWKRRAGGGG